jgi:hypothetical protein
MNITGKTLIFKNDYGYTTTISKKNQNGEYERMYVAVQLPRNVELENKTMIEITKGFLSFYKNKNGLPVIKLVVMEYQLQDEQEERQAIQNESDYDMNFGDLPF